MSSHLGTPSTPFPVYSLFINSDPVLCAMLYRSILLQKPLHWNERPGNSFDVNVEEIEALLQEAEADHLE